MSKYVDIGERLIAWAESLTEQEKAEARAALILWCEKHERKVAREGKMNG